MLRVFIPPLLSACWEDHIACRRARPDSRYSYFRTVKAKESLEGAIREDLNGSGHQLSGSGIPRLVNVSKPGSSLSVDAAVPGSKAASVPAAQDSADLSGPWIAEDGHWAVGVLVQRDGAAGTGQRDAGQEARPVGLHGKDECERGSSVAVCHLRHLEPQREQFVAVCGTSYKFVLSGGMRKFRRGIYDERGFQERSPVRVNAAPQKEGSRRCGDQGGQSTAGGCAQAVTKRGGEMIIADPLGVAIGHQIESARRHKLATLTEVVSPGTD